MERRMAWCTACEGAVDEGPLDEGTRCEGPLDEGLSDEGTRCEGAEHE